MQTSIVNVPLRSDDLRVIFKGLYDIQGLPPRGHTPDVPVLIVPHHLTASMTIAAGVSALVAQKPHSIVMLSPDHFGACDNSLCTGDVAFHSSFGRTMYDPQVLEKLRASPLVTFREKLFEREHGITAIIPFLSSLLPDAQVTPIVIAIRPDWKSHREELRTLFLSLLSDDTVLMISSDFSHYLPLIDADRADERTMTTMFARDIDGLGALENPSQSDCPACLWLAASIADTLFAYNPSVLLHTNSARILHDESVTSTTSHFAIAMYRSARLTNADPAFAGDVTLTRATTRSRRAVSSSVAQFWSGTGARIVNLEGPLDDHCVPRTNEFLFCNSLTLWRGIAAMATHWGIVNNHALDAGVRGYQRTRALLQREGEIPLDAAGVLVDGMRVYALTNVMNPVAEASRADRHGTYMRVREALRRGSGSAVPAVVFVHAGTEYQALPTEGEQRYLRGFVDSGARAVIAVHSHIPGGMEMYKGAPIFYGLGNFFFDQYDRLATMTAMIVRLRPRGNSFLFETRIAQ